MSSKTMNTKNMQPGEVTMKWWCITEAEKEHRTPCTIWRRLKQGYYPDLKKRYVNKRVVYVQMTAP